jgi:hypothetical protein
MIRVIFAWDATVRDSLTSLLSLEKKPDEIPGCTVYQRAEWILVYSLDRNLVDIFSLILEYFAPDRLYIPILGRAVDVVHEIGDVILPNVFLTYNPLVGQAEIDEENRDSFLGKAHFLELYNEQKDYYIEDFGLSVGGIIVDNAPSAKSEIDDKLMLAYEADIYSENNLKDIYTVTLADEIPTIISAGVIEWKEPKNLRWTPIDHTMRNMLTTWRLLEDENQ